MAVRKRPASTGAVEPAEKRPKKEKVVGRYEEHKGRAIPLPIVPRRALPSGSLAAICWNVAGLRAFLAKQGTALQTIGSQEKPAVLGLLETKLQEGAQVDEATACLQELLPEYRAFFSCSREKKGYSGTAVLLREDLVGCAKVTPVKLEKGSDEGRSFCVELPQLFVVICYVVNSGDGLGRLKERLEQWDPRLRSYLRALAKKRPVLLLGDMNVAHRDVDIWNLEAPHVPKTAATTPEERASFGKLLQAGFVDAFAHLHPDVKGAFTYWSVRARNRTPNRGLRLDYAVVSQDMVEDKTCKVRLLDAFHLPALAPSGDHCPVGVTISLS